MASKLKVRGKVTKWLIVTALTLKRKKRGSDTNAVKYAPRTLDVGNEGKGSLNFNL